jgi:hypothetical protein
MIFRVAASSLLLLGIACGPDDPDVTAGRVVGREYDDPDTWTSSYCVVWTRIGDVPVCAYTAHEEHHDGPHWKLQLECDPEDDGKDKVYRSWTEVDEITFSSTKYDYPPNSEGNCAIEADK